MRRIERKSRDLFSQQHVDVDILSWSLSLESIYQLAARVVELPVPPDGDISPRMKMELPLKLPDTELDKFRTTEAGRIQISLNSVHGLFLSVIARTTYDQRRATAHITIPPSPFNLSAW